MKDASSAHATDLDKQVQALKSELATANENEKTLTNKNAELDSQLRMLRDQIEQCAREKQEED